MGDDFTPDDGVLGGAGNDRIQGAGGLDIMLFGEGGADWLSGGQAPDLVDGGRGADDMRGGDTGIDLIAFFDASTGVTVNLGTQEVSGAGRDALVGFEGTVGSPFDDDLIGARGEQHFVPLDGDDAVRGAGGFDAVFYDLAEAGVEVDLSHQEATGEGTDSLISTETVVGSAFADTILGSTRSNFLIGQGGDDWLQRWSRRRRFATWRGRPR